MLLLTFYYLTINAGELNYYAKCHYLLRFAVCGWRHGLFGLCASLCSMLKDLISLCIQ